MIYHFFSSSLLAEFYLPVIFVLAISLLFVSLIYAACSLLCLYFSIKAWASSLSWSLFFLVCSKAELRRARTLELPIRLFSTSAFWISAVESISAVTGILKTSVLVTIYKFSLILEEPSILESKMMKTLRVIPGAIAP